MSDFSPGTMSVFLLFSYTFRLPTSQINIFFSVTPPCRTLCLLPAVATTAPFFGREFRPVLSGARIHHTRFSIEHRLARWRPSTVRSAPRAGLGHEYLQMGTGISYR